MLFGRYPANLIDMVMKKNTATSDHSESRRELIFIGIVRSWGRQIPGLVVNFFFD